MSFAALLQSISIDKDMYINVLKMKLNFFYNKDLVKTYKKTHLLFVLEIFVK
jgi:hypothetical protein